MVALENYEIKETIHIGSEIEVYRGIDIKEKRPVIIKFVPKTDVFDHAVINLKNEFEIMKHLTSANMLKVYGLERKESGYTLLLEDTEGKSLKKVIQEGKLELESFFKIAIHLSEILYEIHRNKIIHKDIKTDNIIVNFSTMDTKIIDFGISTRLSREETKLTAPNVLEGSIQYISPEQTGRMNRSVDYRSDFYSLGVTFYEILTRKLPFENDDLLELVHSHLAKTPVAPNVHNPEIPESLSKIILKLMAKTAEGRYQTALGLKHDIEKCYKNFQKGNLEDFPLGTKDTSDEFRIPQKLYGREDDVSVLLGDFKKVKDTGKTEVILIGGYSGVGKSSLIKEINKPITEYKGYFITGKYDQYNRNLPFSAIIQVFTNLTQLILTEEPASIERWKNKIVGALGSNGKIITDVIPELEYVIGKQPALAELGSQENANRFYIVFQNFIKVFADAEHPLAIFLDDMQWSDAASLILLKNLIVDSSVSYLYLMLAFRDNEVDSAHPFISMIDSLKKENFFPNSITLKPLQTEHLNQLISDTLHCSLKEAKALSELVLVKTGGNPFFINELLKLINKNGLIQFDYDTGKWKWDFGKIQETSISNNVVELLVGRIKKLSPKTQNILKLASCIGSAFDLATLARINESSPYETDKDMLEAIQEELIVNVGDNWKFVTSMRENKDQEKNLETAIQVKYKFQHDRVQQASYELIQEEIKRELRLRIGRILWGNTGQDEMDEKIFEIVNHLNVGIELVTEPKERNEMALLNFKAGKKAKASAAYKPALYYMATSMELLSRDSWKKNYENTFPIYKERAELEFLNGNFEKSEELINTLLKNTKTEIEKADIYYLLMLRYIIALKAVEAIDAGKKGLNALGVILPEKNLGPIIQKEMKAIEKYQTEEDLDKLYNKNDLAKPEIIAALKILNNLSPAAYLAGQGELWALIALRGVNLSIKHGIHRYSSVAFTEYSLMLSAYGNYKRAFLFATLGQRLSEKWGTLSLFQKSRNSLVIGNFTYPWNRHIKESEEINASGYQAGLDSGNLIYAGYILLNQPLCSFYQGLPLKSILEKLPGSLNFTKKNKDELSYNAIMATRIVASSLAGLTKDKSYFDTDEIDDQSYLENCHTVKDLWSVSQYLNLKAQALYHYDEFEEALKVITEAKNFLGYTQGLTTIISSHNFYHSLILAALYPTKDKKEKKEFMIQLKANQAQMKIWTENCPENFQHKYLLINAEIGRIKNHKKWKVVGLYEDSIEEARKNNFIQNDALANELATKYWIEIGKRKFAEAYLLTAFRRYEEWGAKRKTDILKEKYKDIFKERKKEASATIEKTITSTTTSSATALYSGQALDLQSVIKSSNVIAGEIKLESLLDKMMRIMIENAGAERGILLLKNEEGLFIEAEGRVDQQDVSVMKSISVKDYKDIPSSIIYFVERTKQNLVLTNASLDDKFNQDDYLREHQIKSVLCAPIMQKGALSGIFYLENNLSEGAFTPDRLQIINILSGQAAISIDNALLYANMEQKVRDRTRELALANEELEMKNKHITESIEYSLTIQQAILPPRALLKNVLHNYFLLFRPKDIVAGDFYWFSKIDDDNIFVVTADCTGHGVPGALMSMIGNNFLNQIVNEKHIFDPSLILQGLNESVRIALQQDKEDTSSRDGMDLCLCKISGNKVTFAGAKRPLIVMKDGKLEVVKGDLASIGGRQKSEKTQYTNREIEIVKGKTSIYLTTDGYIDQPDPDRNRIGSKGLYNLIEKYHNLTGDEQLLKFSDALDSHKRYEEQRDDITVMGIMF